MPGPIKITSQNSNVTVTGSNNVANSNSGSSIVFSGSGNVLVGAGINLSLTTSNTGFTLSGDNDTMLVGVGDTVSLTGTGDVLHYVNGGTLNLGSSVCSANVIGDGVTAWMSANGGTVAATGNHDIITGGTNATITLVGDQSTIGTWSGAYVSINGHNDIVSGTGITVLAAASGTSVTVFGNSDTITAATGSTITVNGVGDTILGSGVNIITAQSAYVTLFGNNEVVNMASGSNVFIANGIGQTVIGSNVTISANANTSFTVTGANDTINLIGPGITLAALGHNAINVSDTAADVAASLGALEVLFSRGNLASITLTDTASPTLNLTSAQVVTDAGALGRINSGFSISTSAAAARASVAALSHLTTVSVVDTAANVATCIDALQVLAAGGKLQSVFFTDKSVATLNLSNAQIIADQNALACITTPFILDPTVAQAVRLATLPNVLAFAVTDVAVNVASSLDALQALATRGKLRTITFLDQSTPVISLSANQLSADTAALALMPASMIIISGTKELHAHGGGTFLMGANVQGIQKVFLDGGAGGSRFTANATAGMVIQAGTDNATVSVGATSQKVVSGSGALSVLATSANAGALIQGNDRTTLEITTGGTVTLNGGDAHLIVQLDTATNLRLGTMAFITATGSKAGHDTITAGGYNQTLKSIGGNDTLVGSSSFGDTFVGTVLGLQGDVIKNFGGSDVIDITDLSFSGLKSVSYNGSSGVLSAADKTQSLKLIIGGGYSSASFLQVNDGHNGTMIRLLGH